MGRALPDALIAQHHQDAMSHKPYSTASPTSPTPPPAPVVGLLRRTDFAPGTICDGWVWNCTLEVMIASYGQICNNTWSMQGAGIEGVTRGDVSQANAVEQLKAFPAPRLDPTEVKKFGRNMAWVCRFIKAPQSRVI